nr:hypothetical protein [Pseudomonas sp. B28(2017)]
MGGLFGSAARLERVNLQELKIVISAIHDLNQALRFADQLLVIAEGPTKCSRGQRHILINDHRLIDESSHSGPSAANLNENYMY